MLRIRRLYNQNRRKVWIFIAAFILFILVLKLLNSLSGKNSSSTNSTTTVNNNYSVISGSSIDPEKAEKINETIDNFFKYCNNKEYENAYDLLSSDCKEELYPSLEDFSYKYVDKMFRVEKMYKTQAWISSDEIGETYRIEIFEDMMSSGNANTGSTTEYFTAVEENDELKLNINDYIGKVEINEITTQDDIEITVISKQVYESYERYKIKVKNKTKNDILLDGFRNNKAVYLLDNKGGKKIAYINELTMQELLVRKSLSSSLEIKFDRVYSTSSDILSMIFEDVILNYKEYKNMENKDDYDNTLKLEINV